MFKNNNYDLKKGLEMILGEFKNETNVDYLTIENYQEQILDFVIKHTDELETYDDNYQDELEDTKAELEDKTDKLDEANDKIDDMERANRINKESYFKLVKMLKDNNIVDDKKEIELKSEFEDEDSI